MTRGPIAREPAIAGGPIMANTNSLAWTSLALAVGVAAIAAMLGLRLWWERRMRDRSLPAIDRHHFFVQDVRRGFGVVLMAMVAAGVYFGSRLPIAIDEPGAPGLRRPAGPAAAAIPAAVRPTHPNRVFVAVWLGICAAVVLLLVLALMDWIATRRYARRHRQAMQEAHRQLIRETLRHPETDADHNGRANGRSSEPL